MSYRTLAVEQIGSIYQAVMGFAVKLATGPSIAIKPAKKHGAPATINLEELLRTAPEKRAKWLADSADQKLTGPAAEQLKAAQSIEDLMQALERCIAKTATPNMVSKGAMVLQPSDERRGPRDPGPRRLHSWPLGRIAQRESARFTRGRSVVRSHLCPSGKPRKRGFFHAWNRRGARKSPDVASLWPVEKSPILSPTT